MTKIKLEEIFETLQLRESAYHRPDLTSVEYWRMVCPEFTEEDIMGLMGTTGNASIIMIVQLNMPVLDAMLDSFVRGIEFGRELERKANASI